MPLGDISNYQDSARSGQPRKLTDQQCDEICDWITECKEHCDMQAWEVIVKLRLNISDSTLFQLMYDQRYSFKRFGLDVGVEKFMQWPSNSSDINVSEQP